MKIHMNILPLLLCCFGIMLRGVEPARIEPAEAELNRAGINGAELHKAELKTQSKDEKKIFITVNEVELILKYQFSLLKMLHGSLTQEGLVVGKYPYDDQKYSIHILALCEKHAKKHNIKQIALASMLEEAKNDFLESTKEFLASVAELRPVFFDMLQLDKEKKPKQQSFFWFWQTKKDELDVLRDQIESFQKLEHCLFSVLEVLNALLSSAPKATAQCYERIEKWQKIKACLYELEEEGFVDESFDKLSFLRFIKYNYLDVLRIGEFTKEQVEIILQEYILSHS